jgi:lipid-A-disaccharide synthase-like uncharacterized protein
MSTPKHQAPNSQEVPTSKPTIRLPRLPERVVWILAGFTYLVVITAFLDPPNLRGESDLGGSFRVACVLTATATALVGGSLALVVFIFQRRSIAMLASAIVLLLLSIPCVNTSLWLWSRTPGLGA